VLGQLREDVGKVLYQQPADKDEARNGAMLSARHPAHGRPSPS